MLHRLLRTGLRTVHLIAFGAYYGAHVFDVAPERMGPALVAVVATGVLFAVFETFSAPVWVVQIRGVATTLKVVLLLCVPWVWDQRIALLTLIVVIGSVVSHMPANLRYYSLLHGRMIDTDARG
jgi:hypothetical protein